MLGALLKPGTFKSSMEDNATPIADPALHAATWEHVLSWPICAWTTAHDPPRVCGPDWTGDAIKDAIRASLAKTGELDPTGDGYTGHVRGPRPQQPASVQSDSPVA